MPTNRDAVGAQGGDLPAAVRASVDGRGRRAIICVARELTQCRSGAARAAAARRDELAEILAELGHPLSRLSGG